MALTVEPSGDLTIGLTGRTLVRIDFANRIVAVDGGSAHEADPGPEWTVLDLRGGIYGGFHRLGPAEDCFDPAGCADAGQHITVHQEGAGQ
jgi:hypothetical protein